MQKLEEEEELGEEEEKADEGVEEVEQEVGPPLLTPLSEDAGNKSYRPGEKVGGTARLRGGGVYLNLSGSLLYNTGLMTAPPLWGYGDTSVL